MTIRSRGGKKLLITHKMIEGLPFASFRRFATMIGGGLAMEILARLG